MMPLFASNTWTPAHGGTSDVKQPASSTGTMTGMSLAMQTDMSSSPNPGAIWTTPVPSSVSTKSASRTRNAFSVFSKNGKSGV